MGPRINPVTSASISNCLKTSVSEATTASFALLLAFAAGPSLSRSWEGSSYLVSLVSNSCSGRLSLLGASFNCASNGTRGISTVNSSSNSSSSKSSPSISSPSMSSWDWFQATTGDSNGGVSEISNLSSLRVGFFDQSHSDITFNLIPTFESGVAVIMSTPKIKTAISSG